MKLLISTPVYISNDNLLKITEEMVNSIKTKYDYQVLLVNNYCDEKFIDRIRMIGKVIDNKENCVASAVNIGLKYGIENKFDFILTCDNDIIYRHDCIDKLIDFAYTHSQYITWVATKFNDKETLETKPYDKDFRNYADFTCFLITPAKLALLKEREEKETTEPYPGFFDENYKCAYYEDVDMAHRLRKLKLDMGVTNTALYYHYGSFIKKEDIPLTMSNRENIFKNRDYFERKWHL